MELDWLKKKAACSTEDLRPLVDRDHAEISNRRQCELLGLRKSADDGVAATQGFEVNRKRVARAMERMGVEAVYPKPKLSLPGEGIYRIF